MKPLNGPPLPWTASLLTGGGALTTGTGIIAGGLEVKTGTVEIDAFVGFGDTRVTKEVCEGAIPDDAFNVGLLAERCRRKNSPAAVGKIEADTDTEELLVTREEGFIEVAGTSIREVDSSRLLLSGSVTGTDDGSGIVVGPPGVLTASNQARIHP